MTFNEATMTWYDRIRDYSSWPNRRTIRANSEDWIRFNNPEHAAERVAYWNNAEFTTYDYRPDIYTITYEEPEHEVSQKEDEWEFGDISELFGELGKKNNDFR